MRYIVNFLFSLILTFVTVLSVLVWHFRLPVREDLIFWWEHPAFGDKHDHP